MAQAAPTTDESGGLQPTVEDPVILRRPREIEDAEMDITPMIDIVFLLLIFFLVAAKIQEAGDVTLPKAMHGLAVSVDNAVILTVAAGSDGDALVYKGDNQESGNLITAADDDEFFDAVAAYVDQVLVGEAKEYVIIKASADVKHREVARVANGVARSEAAQSMHVAVLEET